MSKIGIAMIVSTLIALCFGFTAISAKFQNFFNVRETAMKLKQKFAESALKVGGIEAVANYCESGADYWPMKPDFWVMCTVSAEFISPDKSFTLVSPRAMNVGELLRHGYEVKTPVRISVAVMDNDPHWTFYAVKSVPRIFTSNP